MPIPSYQGSFKKIKDSYEIVMVPFSGSGLIRISSSPASPSNEASVTLKNLSLSRASLALLKQIQQNK